MIKLLKFFFSFKGRMRRLHYFLGNLVTGPAIAYVQISVLANSTDPLPSLFYYLLPLAIVCGISAFTMTYRRMQDVGIYGLYLLLFSVLSIIPGLSLVFMAFSILLIFKRGTRGPNKFGADPLALHTNNNEETNHEIE